MINVYAIDNTIDASPHFSQVFYCGTAMPRVDCVALDLGAQRTAKYASAPKASFALSPLTLAVVIIQTPTPKLDKPSVL